MNNKGKKQQVLFEPGLTRDNFTGELMQSPNGFMVWTDKGLGDLIRKVEGVVLVGENVNGLSTYYAVTTDRRFDLEFVKAEIEAAVILEIGDIEHAH